MKLKKKAGTWGPGIFENDKALDFIENISKRLQLTIKYILLTISKDFEQFYSLSKIVPVCIKLLIFLIKNCKAVPPKVEDIKKWKFYFLLYEDMGHKTWNEFPTFLKHKNIVKNNFNYLISLSKGFYNK